MICYPGSVSLPEAIYTSGQYMKKAQQVGGPFSRRATALLRAGCSTASGDIGAEARITWIDGYVKSKAVRPVDISPWLFCTRKGGGYFNEDKGTACGWDSMWQRFVARILAETNVQGTVHRVRPAREMRERCPVAGTFPRAAHASRSSAHAARVSPAAGACETRKTGI
jgi:hypothetical protein